MREPDPYVFTIQVHLLLFLSLFYFPGASGTPLRFSAMLKGAICSPRSAAARGSRLRPGDWNQKNTKWGSFFPHLGRKSDNSCLGPTQLQLLRHLETPSSYWSPARTTTSRKVDISSSKSGMRLSFRELLHELRLENSVFQFYLEYWHEILIKMLTDSQIFKCIKTSCKKVH